MRQPDTARSSYCGLVTQPGWPAELTRLIAGEIRRYRNERGLSGQQLADRCARFGLEISRATITDLENGRRVSMTVAELLVLAAALEVSPLLLVVPLGLREDMEILPGLTVNAWDAAKWIGGGCQAIIELAGDGPAFKLHQEPTAIDYFRAHDAVLAAWRRLIQHMTNALAAGDDSGGRTYRAAAENTIKELAEVRARMAEAGLLLPQLPPELEHVGQPDEMAR